MGPNSSRRGWLTLAAVLSLIANAAFQIGCQKLAQSQDARFSSLGHKMICSCGCNQILLECNHVGCPLSEGMRHELTAGLQSGKNDQAILASFVAKYGPTVLAAPQYRGFEGLAWIMPFAVFLLSFGIAAALVRTWRRRVPTGVPADLPPTDDQYRQRIRRETDL